MLVAYTKYENKKILINMTSAQEIRNVGLLGPIHVALHRPIGLCNFRNNFSRKCSIHNIITIRIIIGPIWIISKETLNWPPSRMSKFAAPLATYLDPWTHS